MTGAGGRMAKTLSILILTFVVICCGNFVSATSVEHDSEFSASKIVKSDDFNIMTREGIYVLDLCDLKNYSKSDLRNHKNSPLFQSNVFFNNNLISQNCRWSYCCGRWGCWNRCPCW